MAKCVGIVDTTFSRIDMYPIVYETLKRMLPGYKIIRYTVPGIKDLPGAAKRLLDSEGCEGVITLGWVGKEHVDKYSYIASSVGLILVELLTGRIIIDVTIHEDEDPDPKTLKDIAINRARKHAENLAMLLRYGPSSLSRAAGTGRRQGREDVGPI